MRDGTLRIGIIGAGSNTRLRHIPGLRAQPGVELAAVANRTRESSQRAAADLAIPHAAGNWREIVADDSIDAVCIGTWPNLHAPVTIAALEAGKHVLCEARMAMDAAEAHAMLRAAQARPELIAQIVPAPHTLAFDRTIADILDDGGIGDLIAVDAQISSATFPSWDAPLHWRHDRDLSGNNIMSLGIWYEAIMRWVGPAATVQALGQTVVRQRRDTVGHVAAVTIPDHVEVLCRLMRGGQLRLSVSSVLGFAPSVEVRLHGTEGVIRVEPGTIGDFKLGLRSARRGDKGLTEVAIPPEKMGGWRVEEEFVNAIRGKEAVTHTDLVTAVKYMEWSDAVCRSLRTGDMVHLPLT